MAYSSDSTCTKRNSLLDRKTMPIIDLQPEEECSQFSLLPWSLLVPLNQCLTRGGIWVAVMYSETNLQSNQCVNECHFLVSQAKITDRSDQLGCIFLKVKISILNAIKCSSYQPPLLLSSLVLFARRHDWLVFWFAMIVVSGPRILLVLVSNSFPLLSYGYTVSPIYIIHISRFFGKTVLFSRFSDHVALLSLCRWVWRDPSNNGE